MIESTPTYKLFQFTDGAGRTPKYILEKPTKTLQLTELGYSLRIIPTETLEKDYERPEQNVLKKIAGKWNVQVRDGRIPLTSNEIWSNILAEHSEIPLFFEVVLPLGDAEIEKIKKWSTDKWLETVKDYLSAGAEIDNRILYILRGLLPSPTFEKLTYEQVARYNPHGVMVLNSGTGKTTSFHRVGEVYTRASLSRMLGYSGSQDTYEADLNGRVKPTVFDDIQEARDENIFSGLLAYEEDGCSKVGLGARTVVTKGASSLHYIANPIGFGGEQSGE